MRDTFLALWETAKRHIQSSQFADARSTLEMLVELAPDSADVRDDLGFVFARLDDLERSIECSLRAVSLNPREPRYYTNLGARYLMAGDHDEAELWARKALALAPTFKSALELARSVQARGRVTRVTEPDVYAPCLRAAMDTPTIIDALFDLHRPGRSLAPDEEAELLSTIDRELGRGGAPSAADATYLRAHAGDLFGFLGAELRWQPDLRALARERFPIRELDFAYEAPPGFAQSLGLFARWERRRFKLLAKLTPPGHRLPALVIHRAQKTRERYPWQQAISGNYFLWMARAERLGSRYVSVGGMTQYELSFASRKDLWVELGPIPRSTSIQRIVIPLVVSGDREYRLTAAAEELRAVRPAFDRFVQSLH